MSSTQAISPGLAVTLVDAALPSVAPGVGTATTFGRVLQSLQDAVSPAAGPMPESQPPEPGQAGIQASDIALSQPGALTVPHAWLFQSGVKPVKGGTSDRASSRTEQGKTEQGDTGVSPSASSLAIQMGAIPMEALPVMPLPIEYQPLGVSGAEGRSSSMAPAGGLQQDGSGRDISGIAVPPNTPAALPSLGTPPVETAATGPVSPASREPAANGAQGSRMSAERPDNKNGIRGAAARESPFRQIAIQDSPPRENPIHESVNRKGGASDNATSDGSPPAQPPAHAAVSLELTASSIGFTLAPINQPTTVSGPGQVSSDQPASAASAAAQLAPALLTLAKTPGGNSQITIRLHPADLGMVQVQIEQGPSGATRIGITAEKAETLQTILRDQTQVHRMLDDAGISAAGRSVTFHVAQPAPIPAVPEHTAAGNAGGHPAGRDDAGANGHSGGGKAGYPAQQADPGSDGRQRNGSPAPRSVRLPAQTQTYRVGLDITA